MQRKVLFAGLAGVVYAHSKQSMLVMDNAAKEKEQKNDRDRIASEGKTAKEQLAAANLLLDKYRARYPDLEEKKVESTEGTPATKFTYSSLETGETVEGFATSYDAGEDGESYNNDTANDIILEAESRS
jgi:hypothetical protein